MIHTPAGHCEFYCGACFRSSAIMAQSWGGVALCLSCRSLHALDVATATRESVERLCREGLASAMRDLGQPVEPVAPSV